MLLRDKGWRLYHTNEGYSSPQSSPNEVAAFSHQQRRVLGRKSRDVSIFLLQARADDIPSVIVALSTDRLSPRIFEERPCRNA